jgi:hypothetical protein
MSYFYIFDKWMNNIAKIFSCFKSPLAGDIPADFRIALLDNSPNPSGVLGGTFKKETNAL